MKGHSDFNKYLGLSKRDLAKECTRKDGILKRKKTELKEAKLFIADLEEVIIELSNELDNN